MIYLNYFKESFESDDIEEIESAFTELIDDWNLHDLKRGLQAKSHNIEYLFFKDNLPTEFMYTNTPIYNPISSIVKTGYSVYINLAGSNDFFRTRNSFLDDLSKVIERLKNMGYECNLYEDRYYTSKFILNIKNTN
jgi:hypothetical protein